MANYFNNAGLFGTSSSSSGGLFSGSFLSDWSNIRSGSYSKVVKAYYKKQAASSTTSANNKNKTDTDTKTDRSLTAAETSARALKSSIEDLQKTGKDSVFAKVSKTDAEGKTSKVYQTDSIYSAMKDYVSDYNSLVKNTAKATSSGVITNRDSLIAYTKAKDDALEAVGITINKDNTLSIDETKFKASDMSKVEEMFSGNTSYGYQASLRASLIDYHAGQEASTYTKTGTYNSYSSGVNFDDWF